MVKRQHKVLSVVLCVALLICGMMVIATNASAASGDTIYVKVNNGWNASTMYCYMWKGSGGSGNQNAAWPGQAMTLVDSTNKIYSYKLTDNYEKVIFNTGSGGSQTGDLTYTGNGGDGKIYDLKAESWSQYTEATTSATQATQATQATTAPSGSGTTVYFKNTAGWTTVNCYMWNSSSDNNSWPGKAMTLIGDDVWMFTADKTYASCIFNNGSTQTSDLTAKDGYIFDYSTGSWEVYDVSPLQIRAYTADPASSVYTGMEVALSATAVSTEGTVSYKFTVKNAAGTTTFERDFAASSTAAWTPTAVGTYTVTFDFKDTAGNTNSRSLTVDVASDATLTKPVIKKVTPSDGSYVKTGETTTISVTAGGGNTGTNLLFYKYVIVDPKGEQNTAYYTLNDTYSFVPTSEGEYTVTVYVQASDNSEAKKTFTLNATGGDIPTDPPTQPTTVTPTTEPTKPTQPTTVTVPTTEPTKPMQPTTVTVPTTAPVQPTTQVVYELGDVNKDGELNIKDATYIQKFLAEHTGYEVTVALGDVDGDGRVSIKDVTEIQRIIAEMY